MSASAIHTVVILTGTARALSLSLACTMLAIGVCLVTIASGDNAELITASITRDAYHTGIAANLLGDARLADRKAAKILTASLDAMRILLTNNTVSVDTVRSTIRFLALIALYFAYQSHLPAPVSWRSGIYAY